MTGGHEHRSRRFRALNHDFGVVTDDAALTAYVSKVFADLAAPGRPATTYELRRLSDGFHVLAYDGKELTRSAHPVHGLATLLWHVNQRAVATSPGFVRLHAGAVARDGIAVALPAPMESGKTTLVAGLLRAGLDYLTDECLALEPATLTAHAYPKALSVDPGSWPLLADLEPGIDPAVRPYLPDQWQVPASSVRREAVISSAEPGVVILPSYRPEAPTALTAISRAEALVELIACTFEFDAHPARDLDVLARLVRRCTCYRLSVRHLDEACALVSGALDDHLLARSTATGAH